MKQPTRADFVEAMGLLFEQERFPRIAGRILGFLLLADAPRSLDAIAEGLGVTKASISTNARMLEARGLLERVGRPGDRRDHYQVVADLPQRTLEARVARMQRVREVLATGTVAARQAPTAVRTRLRRMVTAYDFVIAITARALTALPTQLAAPRPPVRSPR